MDELVAPGRNALQRSVSADLEKRLLWLPDHTRSMGIHLQAGKGSGKSRLMGRVLAWLDFVRGIPLVILDPNGPSIDNFLDKLTRLPREQQERLWKRVRYVDMSGKSGYVTPFPLYYRLGNESLYEISQRYLDVIRKIDPWLQSASVEGWNPLWRIGTYTGMVLAALGYQITEAERLLHSPQEWDSRFSQALAAYPEVQPAVAFFTEQYTQWNDQTREKRTDAFRNKIAVFRLDPAMQAMFGTAHNRIDWEQVVEQRSAVLLDFRHELDLERRRFKMLWAFSYLLDFIKHRGPGRHRPISLIVDELTALLNTQALTTSVFAADLDELINVIARNYMVWLTIAHQELYQLDERMQKTLLTMGTQIFGASADVDAALALARHLFPIDPYQVKRYEPVYAGVFGVPEVIDHRPIEFTIEEQQYLKAYELKNQRKFRFLVRPATAEGDIHTTLYPISIEHIDHNLWVNEALVAEARACLSRRCGVPIAEVCTEIQAWLQMKTDPVPAILKGLSSPYATDDEDGLLREKTKTAAQPARSQR